MLSGMDMTMLKWLLIAAAGYLCILGYLYVMQRSLMYFPETVRTAPAAVGLPQAEAMTLVTPDGEHVIVWHVPPRADQAVVLYLHGNGGALSHRADRFRALVADGTGLVALDYRGYGGSSGSPSEAGLITDAETAYRFTLTRYSAARIELWGESLGSAVAIALAAENTVGHVILEAPFASAEALAARHYPFVPVRLLMLDQFRSDERIGRVTAPLLFLHGDRDAIVPIAEGERLFALAHEPKRFVRFAGGEHEGLDAYGALEAVKSFLGGKAAALPGQGRQ
jgi:uncharacterized protein